MCYAQRESLIIMDKVWGGQLGASTKGKVMSYLWGTIKLLDGFCGCIPIMLRFSWFEFGNDDPKPEDSVKKKKKNMAWGKLYGECLETILYYFCNFSVILKLYIYQRIYISFGIRWTLEEKFYGLNGWGWPWEFWRQGGKHSVVLKSMDPGVRNSWVWFADLIFTRHVIVILHAAPILSMRTRRLRQFTNSYLPHTVVTEVKWGNSSKNAWHMESIWWVLAVHMIMIIIIIKMAAEDFKRHEQAGEIR